MSFSFKIKIKINGKEYSNVEEVPDDLRPIYEKALLGNAQNAQGAQGALAAATKIKFNGQEFASLDEMPPEARRLYEAAMGMMQAHPGPGQPSPAQSQLIADAIAAGNKIEAIQLYRSATGTDLTSSKEFIEKLAATLHEKDPAKYPASPSLPAGKGCLGLVALLFLAPAVVAGLLRII